MRRSFTGIANETAERPFYTQASFLFTLIGASGFTVLARGGFQKFEVLRDELLAKQGFMFFSYVAMTIVGMLALTMRRKYSGLDQKPPEVPALVREAQLSVAGGLIGWPLGLLPWAIHESVRSVALSLALIICMGTLTLAPYAVSIAIVRLAIRETDRRFRRTKMWAIRLLGAVLILMGVVGLWHLLNL